MTGYAELLIRITNLGVDAYSVEMEYTAPRAKAATEPDAGRAVFDFERLISCRDDTDTYGALLTEEFFAEASVRSSFLRAASASDVAQVPLRIRLLCDPLDADLHALRWELLRHPESGGALTTNERFLFSRYLRSPDWQPVQPRDRSELRALVMVANPTDLASFSPEGVRLQPLDVDAELKQAIDSLGSMPVTSVASAGLATLSNLAERLRDAYDIVYLVCHGSMLRPDRPLLYMENAEGASAPATGTELAELIGGLRTRPTLFVLAACQSAGSGGRGALAAVGPRLARAGVPAVLAMQGKISVQTSGVFMKRFFKELAGDGQIDRAVAVARYDVKDRPDAWMPVLFTRLKTGSIRSVTLSGDDDFEKWPALLARIRDRKCVPIIGPGLFEFLLGSQREVAQRWAKTYRFPMAPSDREDLPQVSQYVAVAQSDPEFPHVQLEKHLEGEMKERYRSQLPESFGKASLDTLVSEIGRQQRQRDTDPYRVLAALNLPVYITTNPDNLMTDALIEAGKKPEVVLCRWKDDIDWPESVYDREPDYRPDQQRPLVFHLYGRLGEPTSMVITEDDYFDYLIGVTKNPSLIPRTIIRAWADHALLFLGFQVENWSFRVLFRSIVSQATQRPLRPHVAVQLDPEQGRSEEPQRARKFLEQSFGPHARMDMSIYWGGTEDFLKKLRDKWRDTL